MAAHRLKTIIQNVALDRIEDPRSVLTSTTPSRTFAFASVPLSPLRSTYSKAACSHKNRKAAWTPRTPGLAARNLPA